MHDSVFFPWRSVVINVFCEVVMRVAYKVVLNQLTGKNFEKVCELCHISINKTPIYGDNGSISPGGVRIG